MAFLAGSLVYFAFWLVLFLQIEPRHRKNVLFNSVFWGIGGVFEGYYLFAYDWVDPARLFDLPTGIEDFICGFGFGGSLSMLWIPTIKSLEKVKRKHFLLQKYMPFIFCFLYIFSRLILTYYFEVHSFYSLLWAALSIVVLFCWLIPEMIVDLIKTSILFLFLTLGHIYAFLLVDENSVQDSWLWETMPYTDTLWGMPVLDLIWGMVLAAFIRAIRLAWAVTEKN
jgi:hypothetical protein